MNDSQVRKTDKLGREDVFITENTADFPRGSAVFLLTQEINDERQKVAVFDAQQTSGFAGERQAQDIYENRRDELIDILEQYVLAAAIVDDDVEGTEARFKMPRPRNDQNLIAKAAVFRDTERPLKLQLIAAGLPAEAANRLPDALDEFQRAALAFHSSEEKHSEATGGMMDSFRKIMNYSRRRDKSVKLRYRNNAAKLAAWTVASHLDRAPKKKKGDNQNDGGNP